MIGKQFESALPHDPGGMRVPPVFFDSLGRDARATTGDPTAPVQGFNAQFFRSANSHPECEGERNLSLSKFSLLVALLISILITSPVQAANTNELVSNWLLSQTNLQTWSADFIQTRALKSLTQPLVSTGRVWFAAPNRFHWELGQPAQTIAVRQPEQMLVIYPRLKRVEKYPLNGEAGPWRDALALLEAGFPRNEAELDSRFKILTIDLKNEVCELTLQPRSSAARRMMSQIKIAFGTNDFLLRATELQFADGSTMRNDFKNPRLNEILDEALFAPALDPAYKVVEPLKH